MTAPSEHDTDSTVPTDERSNLNDSELVCSSENESESGKEKAPICPSTVEVGPDGEEFKPFDPNLFVEVEFKGSRRGFYLNDSNLPLDPYTYVIVEAEKGVDLGCIVSTGHVAYLKMSLRSKPCLEEPRKVVRLADQDDVEILDRHREQEEIAFEVCKNKIVKHDLEMKLIDVEFQFDRNRVTFYFTADGRIDFRELVKDLAAEYRTRIELRQIGVRDQAKRFGGIGNCGRDLCCAAWIDSFEHISTEMARIQNLPLNPFKLAGQCGRLKCCLAYESEIYLERLKEFPPLESRITTARGVGTIEKIDVFNDAVFLHFDKDDSWERLTLNELNEIIGNK